MTRLGQFTTLIQSPSIRGERNRQGGLPFDVSMASDDASDPHPEYVEVLEDLRERLERWMVATDDPLPDGPVPYSDPQ